jgi:hypothetical protein
MDIASTNRDDRFSSRKGSLKPSRGKGSAGSVTESAIVLPTSDAAPVTSAPSVRAFTFTRHPSSETYPAADDQRKNGPAWRETQGA